MLGVLRVDHVRGIVMLDMFCHAGESFPRVNERVAVS
jgi:hypothetical protein